MERTFEFECSEAAPSYSLSAFGYLTEHNHFVLNFFYIESEQAKKCNYNYVGIPGIPYLSDILCSSTYALYRSQIIQLPSMRIFFINTKNLNLMFVTLRSLFEMLIEY
jgi:hypothetical protein